MLGLEQNKRQRLLVIHVNKHFTQTTLEQIEVIAVGADALLIRALEFNDGMPVGCSVFIFEIEQTIVVN